MIFYFSATGNSLYAANKLAESESTACVSVTDFLKDENGANRYAEQMKGEKAVGFVFPVYFCGLPEIVSEFLAKLPLRPAEGKYLFLVLTYGAMAGNAAAFVQKELSKKGLSLSASYAVLTIDSYLPMFPLPEETEMERILAGEEEQLVQICDNVKRREMNTDYVSHGTGAAIITAIMRSAYHRAKKTSKFILTDACTGCGQCERICPSDAIRMENKKPVWVKGDCTLCLGCLHRCPAGAIAYGKKTAGRERYCKRTADYKD